MEEGATDIETGSATDDSTLATIGQILVVSGSVITSIACIYNSVALDHLFAMKIWRISNILMLCWAYGFMKSWWKDGLAARFLVGMYLTFVVTNEIGIRLSGGEW